MTLPDFAEVIDLEAYQSGDSAAIVRQAQAAIRSYCGWHVAPSITETLTLDGAGGLHLWLPSLHVTAVSSVTNEGTTVDLLNGLDWSQSGYLELRSSYWSTRPRSVVVSLTHGYLLIPDDLVEVAVSIASRAASSPSGAVEESTGPFRAKWSSVAAGVSGGVALLQHERDILDKYKLPPRA